jgi:hypothetical protein
LTYTCQTVHLIVFTQWKDTCQAVHTHSETFTPGSEPCLLLIRTQNIHTDSRALQCSLMAPDGNVQIDWFSCSETCMPGSAHWLLLMTDTHTHTHTQGGAHWLSYAGLCIHRLKHTPPETHTPDSAHWCF